MALEDGTKAPEFTLTDSGGDPVSLSDFRDQRHIVLLFFPLAFSSVCTHELCVIRDNMKIYESLDSKVLAISVDSFFTLREFKKSEHLKFSLLSDFNKEVSEKYEAIYQDYYGMKGVSKRAVYLVDKKGIIRYSEVLQDSGKIPDFETLQKELSKL